MKSKFSLILLTIGSIYTKLGDFVKLGPLEYEDPDVDQYRLVPSPSRFEIRQCGRNAAGYFGQASGPTKALR